MDHLSLSSLPDDARESCQLIASSFDNVNSWVRGQAREYMLLEQDLRLRLGTHDSGPQLPPYHLLYVVDFRDLVSFALPTLDEPLVPSVYEEFTRLHQRVGLNVAFLGLRECYYPFYLARAHQEEYEAFLADHAFQEHQIAQALSWRATDIAGDELRVKALNQLDRSLRRLSQHTASREQRYRNTRHIRNHLPWLVAQLSGDFNNGLSILERMFSADGNTRRTRVTTTVAEALGTERMIWSQALLAQLPDEETTPEDVWLDAFFNNYWSNADEDLDLESEQKGRPSDTGRDRNLERDAKVVSWVQRCNQILSRSALQQSGAGAQPAAVFFLSSARNVRIAFQSVRKSNARLCTLPQLCVGMSRDEVEEWKTILRDPTLDPTLVCFHRDSQQFRAYLSLASYEWPSATAAEDDPATELQMLDDLKTIRRHMFKLVSNTQYLSDITQLVKNPAAVADHERVFQQIRQLSENRDLGLLKTCVEELENVRYRLVRAVHLYGILSSRVLSSAFPSKVPQPDQRDVSDTIKRSTHAVRRTLNDFLNYFRDAKKDSAEFRDLVNLEVINYSAAAVALEIVSKHTAIAPGLDGQASALQEHAYFSRFADFPCHVHFRTPALRMRILELAATCGEKVGTNLPAAQIEESLRRKQDCLKRFVDDLSSGIAFWPRQEQDVNLERMLANFLLLVIDRRDTLLISLIRRLFPAAPSGVDDLLRDAARFADIYPEFFWESALILLRTQRLKIRRTVEALDDPSNPLNPEEKDQIEEQAQGDLRDHIENAYQYMDAAYQSKPIPAPAPYRFLHCAVAGAVMHRRLFKCDLAEYNLSRVIEEAEAVYTHACSDRLLAPPGSDQLSYGLSFRDDACNLLVYALALKDDMPSLDRAHDILHEEKIGRLPVSVLPRHILHTRALVHDKRYHFHRDGKSIAPAEVGKCYLRALTDYTELVDNPEDPTRPAVDWIWRESKERLSILRAEPHYSATLE